MRSTEGPGLTHRAAVRAARCSSRVTTHPPRRPRLHPCAYSFRFCQIDVGHSLISTPRSSYLLCPLSRPSSRRALLEDNQLTSLRRSDSISQSIPSPLSILTAHPPVRAATPGQRVHTCSSALLSEVKGNAIVDSVTQGRKLLSTSLDRNI